VIWTIVGLYIALVVLLHIPAVQSFVGGKVADAVSSKLGTKVSVGRVDLGFLNRLIIDDVEILDQSGKSMLSAARLTAKLDIEDLSRRELGIGSIRLFGLKADLYRPTPEAKPNYQFVIDSLASKDDSGESLFDRFHANDIIIRHSDIKYNVLSALQKDEGIDPNHLAVSNISGHFNIRHLSKDSVNVGVKNLSMEEQSGLSLKNLSFHLGANRERSLLTDFALQLPRTKITIDKAEASYRFKGDSLDKTSLKYEAEIKPSSVTPADAAALLPQLKNFSSALNIRGKVSGDSRSVRIPALDINSDNKEFALSMNGAVQDLGGAPRYQAQIRQLNMSASTIDFVSGNLRGTRIQIPDEVRRLGSVYFKGDISGQASQGDFLSEAKVNGILDTDIGDADLTVEKRPAGTIAGHIDTEGLDLGKLLDNEKFGKLAASIDIDGNTKAAKAKGHIGSFTYNDYTYNNIDIDGKLDDGKISGLVNIDDNNISLSAEGEVSADSKNPAAILSANISRFNPSALHLTDKLGNKSLRMNMYADMKGSDISTARGTVDIDNMTLLEKDSVVYQLDKVHIESGSEDGQQYLSLISDFAMINMSGKYDYSTIAKSITNLLASKIPTMPGLPAATKKQNNNFSFSASIDKSDWLNTFFGVPLTITRPMTIEGEISDDDGSMQLKTHAGAFNYKGNEFRNLRMDISSPDDTLSADISVDRIDKKGKRTNIGIDAQAAHNKLLAQLSWDNLRRRRYSGTLNTETRFFRDDNNRHAAEVAIQPSEILINDSVWTMHPSTIVYNGEELAVSGLQLEHGSQHLIAQGTASKDENDSIVVDLNGIDIEYVLNIINFHSVDFGGKATGTAVLGSLFKDPSMHAKLQVDDFTFEHGPLGTLYAETEYNKEEKQLDITARAIEDMSHYINISGNVSPARNGIDLHILPAQADAAFAESFCGSFMDHIDAKVDGDIRLTGPFSDLQLLGWAVVNGNANITPLNTNYTLRNDTIIFTEGEMTLDNAPFYDRNNHEGRISGAIHHEGLGNLSYDFDCRAKDLLVYDFTDFGDGVFCGTVYADGTAGIHGKRGEVVIDMEATPTSNTIFTYNASSPDAVNPQEYLHWRNVDPKPEEQRPMPPHLAAKQRDEETRLNEEDDDKETEVPTNIYLNFLINCNQNATVKLIMDEETNDYIALNGDGTLRATYYNKGAFDMFGTYTVDHGVYKLTIQNIIKKDFQFQQGGTIVFGGDPYNAGLNLKAQYLVNAVSLSDLGVGSSFSKTTTRVNCLMNITGMPKQPQVDFDLELPTVNSDEEQMIRSVINSQEEMNQQVLYLLAIGRFYTEGANNAMAEEASQYSQTQLAMQSILSGTISSQLNSVLSSVINNNNWNFGANISTGTEGWNNAEYEGLLSGRLLNNRLLINGQFGYRDNAATANTTFIGDFDIRYLLTPGGSLAVKVYNQTNDRYFTKSSLNTQGVGLIVKKDFTKFGDLFKWKRKKKTKKTDSEETNE